MNNIYLIGILGVGKTTIGKLLAEKTNMKWVDADVMIVEKGKMPISEMFAKYGEKYFRDLETEVMREISKMNNLIVSCGGGVILKEENVILMRNSGTVLWLQRDIEKVIESVKAENRPLLKDGKEKLYSIFESRKEKYKNAAHYIIDNNKGTDITIKEILAYIK